MTHTVLIIDNQLDVLDVVAYALRQDGFQVKKAYSANEVNWALTRDSVATAIFDISLPDMEGMELFHRLRQSPQHKDLPLHILSVLDETMPSRYTWDQNDFPVANLAINTFGDLVKHNLTRATNPSYAS